MRRGDVAIEGKGLTIGYRQGNAEPSIVARDLSIALRAGELVCLLGPNGAGKSTLIRTLAGLENPLSGCIHISGTDTKSIPRGERARLASVVLTDSISVGLLSVYSLVALGRHPHTKWSGGLTARDRSRIDWALNAVGIEQLADRYVEELSDGERQKAMIARALAQDAKALLLDEPTAFVDMPRRVELMRLLSDLASKECLAVLLSSHDLELSIRCADRLWLMKADGSLFDGVPESMALNGKLRAAFESDALDWDVAEGGFRMRRASNRRIRALGEGEASLWTRRMLARLGYSVTESPEDSLEIRIEGEGSTANWVARDGSDERRFKTLDEVADWVRLLQR
ncbi:MAG: hypothetical protein CBD18_09035 [Opitutales bacterium TMED158]|nr:MAG: hypothetical protein CBD18_09035 [Opitutales bacterium TMED158]